MMSENERSSLVGEYRVYRIRWIQLVIYFYQHLQMLFME